MSLKVAIVGLGGIGNTHARVYAEHPECEIAVVIDDIAEKAEQAAATYGCAAFASVADMVADGVDVNVASMCTSTSAHSMAAAM